MKPTASRRGYLACNAIILGAITLVCLSPLLHLLAVSLSSNKYALAGQVSFWPRGFTLDAYSFLAQKSDFTTALMVSLQRVLLGSTLNMLLVVLTAYPLSRENADFKARTLYVWIFAITMFFGGGLIPTYMVIKETHIINTIWALVLPGALNVWNCVMLLNFFRSIPKALEEAARIDGAGHMTVLFRIFIPLSLPSMATILLFTVVGHWNAWFDGFMYMNSPDKYPLQTYLATLVMQANMANKAFITAEDLAKLENVSDKTLKVAQIFLGALPIMCVYPFVQRYFIKGIVVGSVKG